MSSWVRSRSSSISERTSSMCIPADSAYWVTLSCSSRAMRWRSSSSTSRCRAAPSSAWVATQLGVAGLEVGGLAGGAGVQAGGVVEQRRVLQRRGRLTGEDAQHGVVGVLDLPLGRRPRGEPADDAPVEPDGHVQVVAAPGARRARRRGARPRTWSTWWRTCAGVSSSGPRTRWRGRTSGSSPSTSANTTHSAERCSAAASTTARTSASEPSMVRTSAPEIRSSARITRRSRSAAIRYSG